MRSFPYIYRDIRLKSVVSNPCIQRPRISPCYIRTLSRDLTWPDTGGIYETLPHTVPFFTVLYWPRPATLAALQRYSSTKLAHLVQIGGRPHDARWDTHKQQQKEEIIVAPRRKSSDNFDMATLGESAGQLLLGAGAVAASFACCYTVATTLRFLRLEKQSHHTRKVNISCSCGAFRAEVRVPLAVTPSAACCCHDCVDFATWLEESKKSPLKARNRPFAYLRLMNLLVTVAFPGSNPHIHVRQEINSHCDFTKHVPRESYVMALTLFE